MSERRTSEQVLGLLAWLGITFAAAAVGALASVQADSFYAQLVRPTWAPPGSWFGPVWSALYGLMAIAAWLVWRVPVPRRSSTPLVLFLLQLAANALWSWLFFAWRLGGAAFVDTLVLLVLLAATLVSFWRVRPLAGMLLLPYLAWVTFASVLTWAVWRGNPGLLG
jgi:translocator protein